MRLKAKVETPVDVKPKIQYINAINEYTSMSFLYRGANGSLMKKTLPIEFVSYHKFADIKPFISELSKTNAVLGLKQEKEWLRLAWRTYEARQAACAMDGPLVKRGVQCFEADVGPTRRYAVEHSISIAKPRGVYLDIETDSRVPIAEKERARILSWCLVDPSGKDIVGVLKHDTDASEAILLRKLWKALDDYDQVLAWYGDGFDFIMIRERSKRLGCSPKDVRRWLWLDQLALFKRMNISSAESGAEKQSYALNNIATALLGEGKHEFDVRKTFEYWEAGGDKRKQMVDYMRQDTQLLRKLEEKTGYIELFQTLCDVCGIFPDTYGLNPTAQVDGFMLRLGRDKNVHYPTKYHYDEDHQWETKFDGAFVLDPQRKGIIKNVHVGDFASMYVNIIRSWNMSPDTKVNVPTNGPIPEGVCRSPSTRQGFRTDIMGILPLAVSEILRLRAWWNEERSRRVPNTPEWKEADRRATAYKVAGNTFYGVIGSQFSRYYDRSVAEGITQNGVWLIKRVMDAVRTRGWEVIYGDTDSIYVVGPMEDEFRDFVKWINDTHLPELVKATGATDNYNKLAYEKEMERIVFTAKKRYCGKILHYKGKRADKTSEPEIKGFEFKRGDVALIARNMQKDVINVLMRDLSESPTDCEKVVRKYLEHVFNDVLPLEEVMVSKSLNKPLSEYKGRIKKDGNEGSMLPHLMLARKLLARAALGESTVDIIKRGDKFDMPNGVKIQFVMFDSTMKPPTTIWAGDYKGDCDRFHLWEKVVWPPTKRLLEATFPAFDWKRYDKLRPKKARGKAAIEVGIPQTGLRYPLPPASDAVSVVDDFSSLFDSDDMAEVQQNSGPHKGESSAPAMFIPKKRRARYEVDEEEDIWRP